MSIIDEIIDYEEHKDDIEHWTLLKGEYKYEEIITFLKMKQIDCTWKNISNYIRYDKRLLTNSFKYLTFLEEFYKSVLIKSENVSNKKILKMSFSIVLEKYLSLDEIINFDNMDLKLLKENQKAIVKLRNFVCHNRILLNGKYDGMNIKEILIIFLKILPESYRSGFVEAINSCSKDLVENLYNIKLTNDEKEVL